MCDYDEDCSTIFSQTLKELHAASRGNITSTRRHVCSFAVEQSCLPFGLDPVLMPAQFMIFVFDTWHSFTKPLDFLSVIFAIAAESLRHTVAHHAAGPCISTLRCTYFFPSPQHTQVAAMFNNDTVCRISAQLKRLGYVS